MPVKYSQDIWRLSMHLPQREIVLYNDSARGFYAVACCTSCYASCCPCLCS